MSNIYLHQNMHFILLYSSQFIKRCWKTLKFLKTSSHEFDLNFHCPYLAYKNSVGILRWPRSDSCLLYFSETLMTFCRAFWLIVSHVFFLLYLVVFRQGDIGTNWYIVLSGSLEVLVSETGDHKVNQSSSYHWLSLRRANRLRVLFYCV